MEKLLNDEMQTQIKEMFNLLEKDVKITLFEDETNEGSNVTKNLLNEIKDLNDKISLEVVKFDENNELVLKHNVLNAPAYFVSSDDNLSGVFYGVPAGHEINTLLTTIIDRGGSHPLYEDSVLEEIKNINEETNIKVFVTTQCPHCPGAAINALRLSQLNKLVTAEVYEVHSNMEIANKYNVSGVPKIVINETEELVGNQPISEFLKAI